MPVGDSHHRNRGRNIALALALAGMVVLFFVMTIVRLGPAALRQPY